MDEVDVKTQMVLSYLQEFDKLLEVVTQAPVPPYHFTQRSAISTWLADYGTWYRELNALLANLGKEEDDE